MNQWTAIFCLSVPLDEGFQLDRITCWVSGSMPSSPSLNPSPGRLCVYPYSQPRTVVVCVSFEFQSKEHCSWCLTLVWPMGGVLVPWPKVAVLKCKGAHDTVIDSLEHLLAGPSPPEGKVQMKRKWALENYGRYSGEMRRLTANFLSGHLTPGDFFFTPWVFV